MIDDCMLNNNKTQVSIIEINGRKLIVYLKMVAKFEIMLEDVETKERVFSDADGFFRTPEEAFDNAFKKLS